MKPGFHGTLMCLDFRIFVGAVVGVVADASGAHGGLSGGPGPASNGVKPGLPYLPGWWNPGFTTRDAVTAAPPTPLTADKTPPATAVPATATAVPATAGSAAHA